MSWCWLETNREDGVKLNESSCVHLCVFCRQVNLLTNNTELSQRVNAKTNILFSFHVHVYTCSHAECWFENLILVWYWCKIIFPVHSGLYCKNCKSNGTLCICCLHLETKNCTLNIHIRKILCRIPVRCLANSYTILLWL